MTNRTEVHPDARSQFLARAGTAILSLLFLFVAAVSLRAEEYRLDSMDKLRVRVVEWQSAEGAVRDWSSISGDYVVGPSGNISLPLIGEMPASGKTTAEIAAAIGDGLQQKLGLPDRPDASVELAEFRPIFVSGDVETPGKYPYDPQLTVLKAISIAGGLRRSDAGQRVERDFITAQGNHDVLFSQRESLLARRARLTAEADGNDQVEFPEELTKTARGRKLIADETAFKDARERRLQVQLTAIDDLKQLLQNEIQSLEKKIASQNRQIELSRKELEGIGSLADRGLVRNERILSLERSTAELEGRVLDMETAVLRAKQDITKAEQDATSLRNDRETEIAQARQQAEADIEALNMRTGMYSSLMSEALARAPEIAASATDTAAVSFSIVRTVDGKSTEAAATEGTAVLPGDVIKVGITPVPAN